MIAPKSLARINTAFDKQFMAMRYLLLGLMANRPEYKHALHALESAETHVSAFLQTGEADAEYQANLLRAFALYPKLASLADPAQQLAALLTPNLAFNREKVVPQDIEISESLEVATSPTLAPVSGSFSKLLISMEYFLLGLIVYDASYIVAYQALLYASDIHIGFRKDGKTPEFQHQLEIAHLIRTMLSNLLYPAETLAAVFLHDTPEDYDVSRAEIGRRFGPRVAQATMLLNKYDEQGNAKPLDEYYAALAYDPIASVAKPGDNGHNQSTMGGVFSYKKQFEYSLNIKTRSWDMMKVARRLWPEQEVVYENLKFLLRVQYNAVQNMLLALQFDPSTGEIHPALKA